MRKDIKLTIRTILFWAFIGFMLGVSLSIMGCNQAHTLSQQHVSIVERTMQSVVKVIAIGYEDMPATGFYIGDGIIVTAGHVSIFDKIEKVIFENDDEYSILDRIVHEDFDCGFLLIENIKRPTLIFNTEALKRGETIFISGHPKDAIFTVSKGIVSGRIEGPVNGTFGDIFLGITDAVAYRGSSGSPIVDAQGKVRGVYVGTYRITQMYEFPTGCAVFIPSSNILKALKHNKLVRPY